MGVTTEGIFGGTDGAEPATPGTYGEPPSGFRLPALRLGPVRLKVSDLGRSIAYYEETLGLRLMDRSSDGAVLGTMGKDNPLVILVEHPGALPARRRGQLGLYHFAILLPDRASLGRFVKHLGDIGARAGAGDHLVSESFYLQDPDNLGIEIYADRPISTWRRIGRQLMMATDPVDASGIIAEAGETRWDGMPAETVMGHLHLHVGSLEGASAFYSELLGFDRMVWQYPGALFLAAGGYHHHLGTNTWAGPGAQAPAPGDAQLLEWNIMLPDATSLDAVAESLSRAGHHFDRGTDDRGRASMATRDPWGTPLRLSVSPGR